MKRALNCWPWVRSLTHSPDAVIHSPGETMAAWPTTVIRSRCPRAIVLRTQKPFSGLWKVTRSTSPARTSRSELSACRPPPPPLRQGQGPRPRIPRRHNGRLPWTAMSGAIPRRWPTDRQPNPRGRVTRFDATDRRPVDKWTAAPRPTTSPQGQKPQQKRSTHMVHKPVNSECSRHRSVGMGRACLFAIRNSRTATGSRAPLPSSSRQRPIALLVVRASSPRNPSSRNTMRLPFAVPITISYQHRSRKRYLGDWLSRSIDAITAARRST